MAEGARLVSGPRSGCRLKQHERPVVRPYPQIRAARDLSEPTHLRFELPFSGPEVITWQLGKNMDEALQEFESPDPLVRRRVVVAVRHPRLSMGGVKTPMVGCPAESRHAPLGGVVPLRIQRWSGGEVRAADLRLDLADLLAIAAERPAQHEGAAA